jgi:hypothetical protein
MLTLPGNDLDVNEDGARLRQVEVEGVQELLDVLQVQINT